MLRVQASNCCGQPTAASNQIHIYNASKRSHRLYCLKETTGQWISSGLLKIKKKKNPKTRFRTQMYIIDIHH